MNKQALQIVIQKMLESLEEAKSQQSANKSQLDKQKEILETFKKNQEFFDRRVEEYQNAIDILQAEVA